DDLQLGAQAAAEQGEIDVQVVVAGRDQHGGGVLEAGAAQDPLVGGVAVDHRVARGALEHGVRVLDPARLELDDRVRHALVAQGPGGGAAHATAAQDHHRL